MMTLLNANGSSMSPVTVAGSELHTVVWTLTDGSQQSPARCQVLLITLVLDQPQAAAAPETGSQTTPETIYGKLHVKHVRLLQVSFHQPGNSHHAMQAFVECNFPELLYHHSSVMSLAQVCSSSVRSYKLILLYSSCQDEKIGKGRMHEESCFVGRRTMHRGQQ